MGPNNLCYVTRYVLFFSLCPHVTFDKTLTSLSTVFIKGHVWFLQLLKRPCHTACFTHVEHYRSIGVFHAIIEYSGQLVFFNYINSAGKCTMWSWQTSLLAYWIPGIQFQILWFTESTMTALRMLHFIKLLNLNEGDLTMITNMYFNILVHCTPSARVLAHPGFTQWQITTQEISQIFIRILLLVYLT